MKKLKIFKCAHCGNVVAKLVDKNVPVFCCGEKMEELVANTIEASVEKHLPIINIKKDIVNIKVGSVEHPMETSHFINFIAIETETGYTVISLSPNDKPEATVYVGTNKPIAVYEYCNLHGLWKAEIK